MRGYARRAKLKLGGERAKARQAQVRIPTYQREHQWEKNMQTGGWKTEYMTQCYVGSTTTTLGLPLVQVAAAKRQRKQAYANVSELPLSPAFAEGFAACSRKYHYK